MELGQKLGYQNKLQTISYQIDGILTNFENPSMIRDPPKNFTMISSYYRHKTP